MNIQIRSKQLLGAVFCLGLLAVTGSPAIAQEERETKETVAMSQQMFEKLTEIQEAVEAEDFVTAQELLDDLKSKERMSPYERAQTYNLQGYVYYLLEDLPNALRAYNTMLQQPELPEGLVLSTLKTMAQLQFMEENYDDALETVQRLKNVVSEPSADIVLLEGQIYYQKEDYRAALGPLTQAVQMNRDQGNTPKENWLLLLHSCHLQLENYAELLDISRELILHYPKDQYILTLAGIYSELGDTKKQLALTEVLYESGAVEPERHAANLANLYLLHEIPYKAAKVLEKEMGEGTVESSERNLRLLSQAWYQARNDEKAIPPFERAADIANDGDLYIRLAQSYVNLDRWAEAATAVENGLRIGGVKRVDQANILLGMALMNQDKLNGAKTAFQRAARDERSRRTANQWVAFVDSEMRRQDLMDQELPDQAPRERDALLEAIEGDAPPDGN